MKIWKMVLILFTSILLCSCGNVKKMPIDVVSGTIVGCGLPSGIVYNSAADSDSGEYLSERVLETVFGNCQEKMKQVEVCALYMTARQEVCEAAAFLCYSVSGTGQVAELCLYRSEILARYAAGVKTKLLIHGRYVFWAAGENAEGIISVMKSAVRGS